jgi:hypothetical protein
MSKILELIGHLRRVSKRIRVVAPSPAFIEALRRDVGHTGLKAVSIDAVIVVVVNDSFRQNVSL